MILDLVEHRQPGRRDGPVPPRRSRTSSRPCQRPPRRSGGSVRIGQRIDGDDDTCDHLRHRAHRRTPTPSRRASRRRRGTSSAGTSWLWARDDMADAVDVLFVDEAGQMSLATVVRRGRLRAARSSCSATRTSCRRSSQGIHPEGAAASSLEHLVGEATDDRRRPRPVPRRRRTASTRPSTRSSRTRSTRAGSTTQRRERASSGSSRRCRSAGPGIRSSPIRTTGGREPLARGGGVGRRRRSPALVGRPWTDGRAGRRPLDVRRRHRRRALQRPGRGDRRRVVKERLGVEANVGTVDKFQGREGAVAIYSMTTLHARGRAARHGVPVLAATASTSHLARPRPGRRWSPSPSCFEVACRTPEQMRMVNAFCRFVEVAAEQDRHGSAIVAPLGRRGRRAAPRVSEPARRYPTGRQGWPRRHIPPMPPRPLAPRSPSCAARRVRTLVAGVALGSTGHIAAVTVATIVAERAGRDGRLARGARRDRRARRGVGVGAAVEAHGPATAGATGSRSATPSASLGAIVATVAVIAGSLPDSSSLGTVLIGFGNSVEPAVALRGRRPVPPGPARVGDRPRRVGRDRRRGRRAEPRRALGRASAEPSGCRRSPAPYLVPILFVGAGRDPVVRRCSAPTRTSSPTTTVEHDATGETGDADARLCASSCAGRTSRRRSSRSSPARS